MSFFAKMFKEPGKSSEVRLAISGAFNAAGVAAARESLEGLAQASARRVVLDLSGVPSMDGSGIGAIAFLFKRLVSRGRTLAVTGVSGQPLALLEELGLTRHLGVDRATRDAVAGGMAFAGAR